MSRFETDVLGRVKTPKARHEQLLNEFEWNALPRPKFAELAAIKYLTYVTWVQKRRRQWCACPAVKRPKQLRWLEAVVEEGQSGGDGDQQS